MIRAKQSQFVAVPGGMRLGDVDQGQLHKQTQSGAIAAQTGVIVNKQSQFPPAARVRTGSIVRNKANSRRCRVGSGLGDVDQGQLYEQTQSGAPAAQTGVNANEQSQFPPAAGVNRAKQSQFLSDHRERA